MVTSEHNPDLVEDSTPVSGPPAVSGEPPAWQTPEFWLTLIASLVGLVLSSNMVQEGTTLYQVITFAAVVLTTLGYQVKAALTESARTKARSELQVAHLHMRTESLRLERSRVEAYRAKE